MSGELIIRFLEQLQESNQDLEGRQYVRSRAASELAMETGLGWTGRLMLIFHERGGQQLCSSS